MIRTFKLLAGAFFLLFTQTATAQVAQWTVSEASGRVTVRDASGEHAARRGNLVSPGATLSTGPGARAVVVRGKDFVNVAANSRIRIPTAAQNSGGFDVVQEWGNAVFQIEKKKNPHFGVRTPYLAAVVKGTTFSITVTQEGASLQVLEGGVETSTGDGGARELIRPGIVASVSAADQFRLTVRGTDTRTIDSPARGAPAAGPAPAASPAVAPEAPQAQAEPQSQPDPKSSEASAPGTTPTQAGPSAAAQTDRGADLLAAQTISETITAQPTDIGKATGGLVGGTNVVQVASAEVAALTRVNSGRNGPSGGGQGNNGNATGPGNGGVNAPAPSGGPGNGNAGPGSNNGAGNGNGGPGSNGGPGNGNAGPGSNNGVGNGNAGPGSNNDAGDGNGGPGSSGGPGNGNAGPGNAGPGSNNGAGNDNAGPGSNNGVGNGNGGPGTDGGPGNGNTGPGSNNGAGNGHPGPNGAPGNGNSGPGTDGGPGAGNAGPGTESGPGNGNSGPGNGNGDAGPRTDGGPGNGAGGPGSNGRPGNGNPRPVVDGDVGPGNGGPGNRNSGPGNGKD